MEPTLCLNMIVKNESNIIERLLSSVLPIIDSYCICDTGSTDNTIEKIENFFKKHNKPGKIVREPFRNFCYNRNYSLHECFGMSDYVLLMDADMVLQINNFKKSDLKEDGYMILQGNDNFHYKNIRIIRNKQGFEYKGVTHEYLNIPNGNKIGTFGREKIFILDVGDGGSKQDKFVRDINLLTDGIKEEPNNVRYYFYLANSFYDIGDLDNAIKYYQKRIEMGGWNEEIWFSYYRIGLCYKKMGNMVGAVNNWLEAYEIIPERLENIYEIIKHYRSKTKYKIAYMFYQTAIEVLDRELNREEHLFLENDVYRYKIYQEYTYMAYYVNKKNINWETVKVLNNLRDEGEKNLFLSNMKFYQDKLICDNKITLNIEDKEFISSTPCMIKNEEGYLINIRMVNYRIDDRGNYLNVDKHIITKQLCYQLDKDFNKISEHKFEVNFDENKRYMGVEDIKLFGNKFLGTTQHENGNIGMVYGDYDMSKDVLKYEELKPDFGCEKNWVFIKDKIIYQWFPLVICELKDNTLEILEKKEMPLFFSGIRGSSCGFYYQNEIWFITHMVSYENPRHYYHVILVFDDEMNLLRYSAPFKFEGEPIEYSLSIIVEDRRVLITYSTWDRTSNIGIYNKKYIESKLVYS